MTNAPLPDIGASTLRQHWSDERAFRTGLKIARATFLLTSIALLLNLIYAGPIEVAADVILLVACLASIHMTNARHPKREFVWWPIYFGFLIAIAPSLWFSGGLYSPWMGIYIGVLALLGAVIQARVNPLYNTGILFAYLGAWAAIDHFYPRANTAAYVATFPPIFMWVAIGLCTFGIGYCLYVLFNTERELTQEIEQRYADLFRARARLVKEESANQAKSAFLANISHELRTPLSAILGYADLIRDPSSSSAEKDAFAETIERNGRQLARLVDDLLDLSKIEAGRIEIERLDCNLQEMLDEVIQLLEITASKKGVSLSARAENVIPKSIVTDPVRFKQILTNVLGNAIKFTDQGSIEVRVRYEAGDRPELLLFVRDTGRGIAPNEYERLFKPFSQADASMTRKYGGTGLGLKFSRDLARLLGGDLDLTWSELGRGSEFRIQLPVGRRPEPKSANLDLSHI